MIRTSVPVPQADAVRKAMGDAGAGKMGNYSHCSGSYRTTGRFIPQEGAHPAIGEIGQEEIVEEEVIRMLCHKEKVEEVIIALKQAHPYEEPAIDIFPRLELS
ncbi:MAG: hypothetical protein H6760_03175 [Candidatus Nomurabacteria bacterium]|nr:MAG: hypothetical protein H6760_03175 [Candidatus Nomurabacteria bacterium]